MSTKKRILYISQEVTPFLKASEISSNVKNLAQKTQESGKEIRVFMPRYGLVNERRNQLHEVIRLSGMNMIINDVDHPLIIKVASIPSAKMQVYFIDNEEYFKRKAIVGDEKGKLFEDNVQRSVFFIRGTLETVKKLGWIPDVIHCHGWMTSLLPLYLKTYFKDDPHYANTKVISSIYENNFEGELNDNIEDILKFDGVEESFMNHIKEGSDYFNLTKTAIDYSDGVVLFSDNIQSDVLDYANNSKADTLNFVKEEEHYENCSKFYDEIIEKEANLAE
ncbi:MAG: glycogen/starch synthase [Flavobacteriales bacterium]